MLTSQMNEEKRIEEAEAFKTLQMRNLAVAKEKIRAQEIARLPPPVSCDLKDVLSRAKAAYVQVGQVSIDRLAHPHVLLVFAHKFLVSHS